MYRGIILNAFSGLIHLYAEVDDGQVYGILRSRLSDFKTFLDGIAVFLKLESF